MGFLRRLFGSSGNTPPAAPSVAPGAGPATKPVHFQTMEFTYQRPEALLEVVGESWRQDAIHGILAAVPSGRGLLALVVPEPDNPKDRNAVKVAVQEGPAGPFAQVGYLSREDAAAYLPVFTVIRPSVIKAEAFVKFGQDRGPDGRAVHGIGLRLGSACELLAEIWLGGRVLTGTHPWKGQMVCFTGASTRAIHGVRLDRETQLTLARKAGCEPWPRMTKKVQLCIVSSTDVDTDKVRKAEEYGTMVLTEDAFWTGVGLRLDAY